MLQQLKNLRKKWRCEATKRRKLADRFFDKKAFESNGKSVGMFIGFEQAALDLDRVIKELESANV